MHTTKFVLKCEFSEILNRFVATNLRSKSRLQSTVAAEKLKEEEDGKDDSSAEWEQARPFDEIPGAKKLPIIGTTLELFSKDFNPTRFHWTHKAKYEQYGPIWKHEFIGTPAIVAVTEPSDIERIFRSDSRFPERPGFQTLKDYREKRIEQFDNTGILIMAGPEWWKFRSKVQQPMLNPQNISMYISSMEKVSKDMVERISLLRDDKLETPTDFINEMYKWALESVALVALDTRLGCLDGELKEDSEPQIMITATNDTFQAFHELESGPPLWKIFPNKTYRDLVAAQDTFTEIALKYINRTLDKIKNRGPDAEDDPTILESILARGLPPKDAILMTSHTTSFLFYHLAKNPEKQEKLFEEIRRVLPRKDIPITAEAIDEMRYLKACVKESLRLSPAANVNARTTTRNMVLSGFQVPKGNSSTFCGAFHLTLAWGKTKEETRKYQTTKGNINYATCIMLEEKPQRTMLLTCHQLIARFERHFPNPDDFIPERWIKKHPLESNAHPYTILPFGFGPRMCIGRRLAEQEMWLLTIKALQEFQIEWHHADMDCITRTVNVPDQPLQFTFRERIVAY